jgi:hypothetical protein
MSLFTSHPLQFFPLVSRTKNQTSAPDGNVAAAATEMAIALMRLGYIDLNLCICHKTMVNYIEVRRRHPHGVICRLLLAAGTPEG